MMVSMMIWPMLAHMLLVIGLFVALSKHKKRAVREGNVDLRKTALDNNAWPDHVLKISNNIQNQFQLPVLFYALCLGFVTLNKVSMVSVALAWLFTLSRFVHSYVHTTTNVVPTRMRIFILGYLCIATLVILLGVQLAMAGG